MKKKEFTRSELQSETVKDLRNIAKLHDIKGRWDMTKEELVVSILWAIKEEKLAAAPCVTAEENDKERIINEVKKVCHAVKQVGSKVQRNDRKMKHIAECSIGTEICATIGETNVIAKIVARNLPAQKLKIAIIESGHGSLPVGFRAMEVGIIMFTDVLWVKDNYHKWPKGIVELFPNVDINNLRKVSGSYDRERGQKKNFTKV